MNYNSLFVSFRSSSVYRYYKLLRNNKIWTYNLKQHYDSFSENELRIVYKKLRKAWICQGIDLGDFYRLHCEDKSLDQMSEFLSYWESSSFCLKINSINARRILGDKFRSYNYFSRFYGRQAILLSSADIDKGKGIEKLNAFVCDTNQPYIIKPLNMNSGKGIKVMSSIQDILDYVKTLRRDVIIEEVIVQDKSMAAFNNSSVNTLRIQTANYGNGEIDVLWPCFRMGRAGSVVDNAGAGGIFSAIDVNTGKTIAAVDESRNIWKVHPDSKKELVGFTIPRWQEAIAFAKKLAKAIPDAGFVAWDLALTKRGWVMVEGNSAPLLIYQIALNRGIRAEFYEMKKKMTQG